MIVLWVAHKSTYNPTMEIQPQSQNAEATRIVIDGVGHALTLALCDKGMTIASSLDKDCIVELAKDEIEILHAFLAVSLKMPDRTCFTEVLRDDKSLSLLDHGSPHVRISWPNGHMDIYPPSWEPLYYEISLLLPRIKS